MSTEISIIIPCYKGEAWLGRTLESIVAQHFTQWECIVVDDGSPDRCAEIAQAFGQRDARVRLLRVPNGGVGTARNAGAAASVGNSLMFMDQDDLLRPEALARLHQVLEADPHAAGAHCLADFIDQAGNPLNPGSFAGFGRNRLGFDGRRIAVWPLDQPTTFSVLITSFTLYPPCQVLVRREVFQKARGFDPYFLNGGADWDFFARASRFGPFLFLNEVLVDYRRHESNGSNNAVQMHHLSRVVRHRMFHSPLNTPADKILFRQAYRAMQRFKIREKMYNALGALKAGRLKPLVVLPAHVAVHSFRHLRGSPGLGG